MLGISDWGGIQRSVSVVDRFSFYGCQLFRPIKCINLNLKNGDRAVWSQVGESDVTFLSSYFQRIEQFWSVFLRQYVQSWREFFLDLCRQGLQDPSYDAQGRFDKYVLDIKLIIFYLHPYMLENTTYVVQIFVSLWKAKWVILQKKKLLPPQVWSGSSIYSIPNLSQELSN